MKKVLLLIAVVAITLPSCKKDYTCECTSTYGTTGSTTQTSTSSVTFKAKKSDAKKSCDLLTMDESDGTTTDKTVCAIK